jgi:two-component sensor histidine kinase
VLTELLQNVVDHAYPDELAGGRVEVVMRNDGNELRVNVTDDGVGLPAGFSLDAATGLGLSIVRALVTTELAGTIQMTDAGGPPGRPGTLVALRVPLDAAVRVEPATGPHPIIQPTGV